MTALEVVDDGVAPASEGDSVVVRFAGDSGDGIQLTGGQFTLETALSGSDLATFPDFPAEIRAPAGTTFGVSAFQIQFSSHQVSTPGDKVDVLVCFNPAALVTNIDDLRDNGLLIVDIATFTARNLQKAGADSNPLEDGSLDRVTVLSPDITKLTLEAVKETGVTNREGQRARNLWALGLVLWLTGRRRTTTTENIKTKFGAKPAIMEANLAALNAGHAFGETSELARDAGHFHVEAAKLAPGKYRNVNGAEALCWGLLAGGRLAEIPMLYCSYPITPATNMLHILARHTENGVRTFQAEDEIAAVCAAIGSSYGGTLGITGSSGPGIALKTEAIGLAIAAEIPLVIVNAQRGGPSTGLPTKTEQSDLFQAVLGRNGDAPMPVIASRSPGDCFDCAVEAVRIATKYMTPVMLLTDGYISNAAEPWAIPDISSYEKFPVKFHTEAEGFHPFQRDENSLARPWVAAGTPGLAHRIGGLERSDVYGNISYDPSNHQRMTDLRVDKVHGIADDIPDQPIEEGDDQGEVLVVTWGSVYGAALDATRNLRAKGHKVSLANIRYVWPFPNNLEKLFSGFDRIVVPELNTGQLSKLLRAEYGTEVVPLNKVAGKPFTVGEIESAVLAAKEA